MRIAMWISATLHWLVVSPGMHDQSEFPTKLFLARLVVVSPLCGWMGWTQSFMSPGLAMILCAVILAPMANVLMLMLQALGQFCLSSVQGRGRY